MTMTPPVYLTGPHKLVDLRLLSINDLPGLVMGANNYEIQRFMGAINGPVSEQFERKWLERVIEPTDKHIVFGVVERGSGQLAGSMGLHNIDHINGKAGTGAFFWNSACHGRGLGTDAKFAMLHWAFRAWPIRKINSSVLANNPRSRAYQEKTGYKEVGRREAEYYRDGQYWDEILMEVFRDKFMLAYDAYVA